MTRLIPHPFVSTALALSWLALAELTLAHVILAAVLAVCIPLLVSPFLENLPAPRRAWRALQLLVHVLWDIVIANMVVAGLVLGPRARLRPVFFEVPLSVSHPHALTLLASMITMTPGTVSVALTPDARVLHVHALSAENPAELTARIKARYERPLMEILPC
jgi:multicomponent K+:H+ antiporter subunit E